MTIQNEVILKQANWPARDQGSRPTCIAFALSEMNLVSAKGLEALSPEYLYQLAAISTPKWMPNAGVTLGAALAAAHTGQPSELDFPYQQNEPIFPIPPPHSSWALYGTQILAATPVQSKIIKSLREHKPVGLCIRLTNSFYTPTGGVVADEPLSSKDALHAVAIIGLGWISRAPYFLIRNSWGIEWGNAGNAWLSWNYISDHSICVMEF